MGKYILKRILMGILVLLGVVTITFVISRVIPSQPELKWAGSRATPEQLEAARIELGLPLAEPICFCMAKAGDEIRREDVLPVILRPGYVFTLHRGTWHSSSHGLNRETEYQWLAWVYYNEPTVWKQVSDGPVAVKLSEC